MESVLPGVHEPVQSDSRFLYYSVLSAVGGFVAVLGIMVIDAFPPSFLVLLRCPNCGLVSSQTVRSFFGPTLFGRWFDTLIPGLLAILIAALLLLAWIVGPRKEGRIPVLIPAVFPILAISLLSQRDPLSTAAFVILGVTMTSYVIATTPAYFGFPRSSAATSVIFVVVLLMAVVGLTGAARWAVNGFDGSPMMAGDSWRLSYLDLQLFESVDVILPELTFIFLGAWILGPLWKRIRRFLRRNPSDLPERIVSLPPLVNRRFVPLLLLVVALVSVIFVCVYPYLPALNPTSKLVGVDVAGNQYYPSILGAMFPLSLSQAISSTVGSDRPFFLVFLYFLAKILGSPDIAIRVTPAILGVLLVSSTYWFAKEGSKDRLLASTAALVGAFSFVVTLGINAGFYANWFAIVLALSFFACFSRGMDEKRSYLILSALFSVGLVFTHPYTWFVTISVSALFLIGVALREFSASRANGTSSILPLVVAVAGVAFLGIVIAVTYLSVGGLPSVFREFDPFSIGKSYAIVSWEFTNFLGGALQAPVVIALALVGLLSIADFKTNFRGLLVSWVIVGAVGVLFGGLAPEHFAVRALYMLPFQVLSAVGFLYILRYFVSLQVRDGAGTRRIRAFETLSYLALFSGLFSYAVMTVGFLYQ